jgi:vancomycin aglycone glucosyltransferase
MKVLLTTVGSRGDVQPILALALELRALGHQALVCAAPNFHTWVESFGIRFFPLGPDVEKWTRSRPERQTTQKKPSRAHLRALAGHTVAEQFRVLAEAARECDLIVVGGMLQTAGRSIAEALKIPYIYASYCPATLPSPDHPPAKIGAPSPQTLPALVNRLLWMENERSFNRSFRDAVNEQRATLGLLPVRNVSRYVTTDHPWLAADPVLGPKASPIQMQITQTGAWLLPDPTPLPDDLEIFLASGEAPLYFGFGSVRASAQTSRILIEAARTLGHRAIISQGWTQLNVIDAGVDCLSIGDINHEKLLPQVAAVVHHGGAGTTTAAARTGRPQVVVPHLYDQYYWAQRVQTLGIGVSGPTAAGLTVDALVNALRECLQPEMTRRAQAFASRMELHGARLAAEQLIRTFG